MSAAQLRLQATMVCATIALFAAMQALNQWLFRRLEFAPGIHFVYLPAGARLLCTLLFGEAGAIGLLVAGWVATFFFIFPGEFERPFLSGILAALAPYGVYRLACWRYGLKASLANLTPRRLLVLALAYSLASPLLQHLYFAWRGQADLLRGFEAMFIGDFTGTLIVIYGIKGLLALQPGAKP